LAGADHAESQRDASISSGPPGELQVSGSTQITNFFLSDGLGSLLGVFSNTANSASPLADLFYRLPIEASIFYHTHVTRCGDQM
jgi:hypothetical protein